MTDGPTPPAPEPPVPGRHPIFGRFRPYDGPAHGSFWTDYLGVRVRRTFHAHYDGANGVGYLRPDRQPVSNEYFEWVTLLCAAAAAEPPFVMFELGSGWGRWALRGALACRRLGKAFRLVAVEPDAQHFGWMQTAFRDNDIDPDAHHLINAAVGGGSEEGWFLGGDPRAWYGQSLLAPDQMGWAREEVARTAGGGPAGGQKDLHKVRVVPLRDLLADCPRVHLLNMDVQNAEADVVEAARDEIDARAELVHIATHSPEVEQRLRTAFRQLGWLRVFDFECLGLRNTPYGEVAFTDGVQTWVNPTASHLLTWFNDPALLCFLVTQDGLYQQQVAALSRRERELTRRAQELAALLNEAQAHIARVTARRAGRKQQRLRARLHAVAKAVLGPLVRRKAG